MIPYVDIPVRPRTPGYATQREDTELEVGSNEDERDRRSDEHSDDFDGDEFFRAGAEEEDDNEDIELYGDPGRVFQEDGEGGQ